MPKSFKGYTVGEKLGAGGMSTLYTGVQTALGRSVAIKFLHPTLADDASFIARFEREARAASTLGHTNIVTVIDFGSDDDVYYIVMERIEGADLRMLLSRVHPLPPEVALAIVEEIAYGLEAAHRAGIIHRDIKPGNVLLSNDGVVKIVDFGLARQHDDLDRLAQLTLPGSIMGTPAYMSPEQATGTDTDHRTDIFSLGVVAYELLTGRRPFDGRSHSEIRARLLEGEVEPASTHTALLTPDIDDLVLSMLEKDPARRPQSMADVLQMIESSMEVLEGPISVLRHRRRILRDFAADPPGYATALQRKRAGYHLERARDELHTEPLGRTDAIRHLKRTLVTDSTHTKAAELLAEIDPRHGMRSDLDQGGDEATTFISPGRSTDSRLVAFLRGRGAVVAGVVVLGVLALVIGFGAVMSGGSRSGGSGTPVSGTRRNAVNGDGDGLVSGTAHTDSPAGQREVGTVPVSEGDGPLDPGTRVEATPIVTPPAPERRERPAAPATGTLDLSTDPAGARVLLGQGHTALTIDRGRRTPTQLELATGDWHLRLELVGFAAVDTVVQIRSGGRTIARPTLLRLETEGTIIVYATPYADLFVNGELRQEQKRRMVWRAKGGERLTIELRHPTLGVYVWSNQSVAAGDTLSLRHTFTR